MQRMLRLAAAVSIFAIVACSNSFSPTTDNVAGTYVATTLKTTAPSSGGINQLSAGVTLTMTLHANGTVTGALVVPQSQQNPTPLTADLAGTWSLSSGKVTFSQSADTFVRNLSFTANKNDLSVDDTVANTRYQVTLTRQ